MSIGRRSKRQSVAEEATACEIIPVMVEASGRYDRGEDMVGLWCAVLVAMAVWTWFPARLGRGRERGVGSGNRRARTGPARGGDGGRLSAGAVVASRTAWLRRLAVPRKQQHEGSPAAPREVFFDQRVHHTAGRTGLLIYVSLLEHEVAVLADQEILGHAALGLPCSRGRATCSVAAENGETSRRLSRSRSGRSLRRRWPQRSPSGRTTGTNIRTRLVLLPSP